MGLLDFAAGLGRGMADLANTQMKFDMMYEQELLREDRERERLRYASKLQEDAKIAEKERFKKDVVDAEKSIVNSRLSDRDGAIDVIDKTAQYDDAKKAELGGLIRSAYKDSEKVTPDDTAQAEARVKGDTLGYQKFKALEESNQLERARRDQKEKDDAEWRQIKFEQDDAHHKDRMALYGQRAQGASARDGSRADSKASEAAVKAYQHHEGKFEYKDDTGVKKFDTTGHRLYTNLFKRAMNIPGASPIDAANAAFWKVDEARQRAGNDPEKLAASYAALEADLKALEKPKKAEPPKAKADAVVPAKEPADKAEPKNPPPPPVSGQTSADAEFPHAGWKTIDSLVEAAKRGVPKAVAYIKQGNIGRSDLKAWQIADLRKAGIDI